MHIDRQELLQEIILRKHIQKLIRKKAGYWIQNKLNSPKNSHLHEQQLRDTIQKLIPLIVEEQVGQNKEEVAISLVRDTLLAVVKIIKSDQSKFKDPEVQDGFIKFCSLALQNDFEENRGEEGEAEIQTEPQSSLGPAPVFEELENDGDDALDIKIKASDHEMFIPDEEEAEEEDVDNKEKKEQELFLTLTDAEKVGFRYAKETTWPKVTKQIKRIHKMALPDPAIADIYEKWLTKNIELHGENTKEESTFSQTGLDLDSEVEAQEFEM